MLLLLLGIVGLHFTAMAAVKLAPNPALGLPTGLVDRTTLAAAAQRCNLINIIDLQKSNVDFAIVFRRATGLCRAAGR